MNEVFEYQKKRRFVVVKKLPRIEQWRSNFGFMHDTIESANTEAARLAKLNPGSKYYIAEILNIAHYEEQNAKTI